MTLFCTFYWLQLWFEIMLILQVKCSVWCHYFKYFCTFNLNVVGYVFGKIAVVGYVVGYVLRNICGLVWWVAFMQSVLNWNNLFLNVQTISLIDTEYL